MVDELIDLRTCRVCGATLTSDAQRAESICDDCSNTGKDRLGSVLDADAAAAAAEQPPSDLAAEEEQPPDPDHPRWGVRAGILVWVVSVLAIIVVPVLAVIAWYIISKARGEEVPGLESQEALFDWLKSPRLLLVQVASTFIAHLITLAVCWLIVVKIGKNPFWASLGWHWAGRSALYWLVFSAVVIVVLIAFSQVAVRVLPESPDTSFAELLRSSPQVRIAVALLATLSAPIVEEVIYRGVLFPALLRRTGAAAAVVLVTMLFAGVHFLQYWGAWASISGLIFLSLILTLVRARTGSILPSVMIHFVNNAFFSMLIIANRG
ncbi:MAG: CPBP family intramembrane glutamic endopeptidase [Acidobacteriota bacterium]